MANPQSPGITSSRWNALRRTPADAEPSTSVRQLLTSLLAQQPSHQDAAALASLGAESNPEAFAEGVLALARNRLANDAAQAGRYFQFLAARDDVPETIRHQAREEWNALVGGGSFGAQLESSTRSFAKQATDPGMLAAMTTGGLFFSAARGAALHRLLSSPAAWWSRGVAARGIAGLAALPFEVSGFLAAERGVAAQRTTPASQALTGRDFLNVGMTLGFLKLGGALGAAVPTNSVGTRAWLRQAGNLLGIGGAQLAGIEFGLRSRPANGALWVDALATLTQAAVGGRLSEQILGTRYAAFLADLDARSTAAPQANPVSQWGFEPALAQGQGFALKPPQAGAPSDAMLGPKLLARLGESDAGATHQPPDRLTLLSGGERVFPRIKQNLQDAQRGELVKVKMYLWRGDALGAEMAEHVLEAAERGVRFAIEKDRYSAIFEHAEFMGLSMFNPDLKFGETVKRIGISINVGGKPRPDPKDLERNARLFGHMRRHPNIQLDVDTVRQDHSKYIDFGGRVLMSGDTNFGLEYANDWHTTMVEFNDPSIVERFHERRTGMAPFDPDRDVDFAFNTGDRFEIRDIMADRIRDSQSEAIMQMSYFGDKVITAAMKTAAKRHGNLKLIIPRKANVQQSLNFKVMKEVWNATGGNMGVYLFPRMLHTKKLFYDGIHHFIGSANANPTTMRLGESNVYIRDRGEFSEQTQMQLEHDMGISQKVAGPGEFTYNGFMAALEYFFVRYQRKMVAEPKQLPK